MAKPRVHWLTRADPAPLLSLAREACWWLSFALFKCLENVRRPRFAAIRLDALTFARDPCSASKPAHHVPLVSLPSSLAAPVIHLVSQSLHFKPRPTTVLQGLGNGFPATQIFSLVLATLAQASRLSCQALVPVETTKGLWGGPLKLPLVGWPPLMPSLMEPIPLSSLLFSCFCFSSLSFLFGNMGCAAQYSHAQAQHKPLPVQRTASVPCLWSVAYKGSISPSEGSLG
jgi:hypothetical protein